MNTEGLETVAPYLYIALALILVWKFLRRNHAEVDKYEYLEVLSYTEWKAGRTIRKELEKLKGGYLGGVEVYHNLAELAEEGLVEFRDLEDEDGKLREFRKKPGGRRTPPDELGDSSLTPSWTPA